MFSCVTVIRNSTFILNLNACCKSKYDNVSFLELFDLDIDMDMDMDLVQRYLGMVCLGYGYVSNMGMFSFYKIFMYLVESLEDLILISMSRYALDIGISERQSNIL